MKPTTKPTTRCLELDGGRVKLVLTLHPNGLLEFRETGGRKSYTINAMSCYRLAVKQDSGK